MEIEYPIEKIYGEMLGFGVGCNVDLACEAIMQGREPDVEICETCGQQHEDCHCICEENRYACDCKKIHRGDCAVCDECGMYDIVRTFHGDKPLCIYCARQILD